MKASLKRENLDKALAVVGRAIKQRATLPVLSNILISTDKGRLKLASTDLESSVSMWIGGKIDEEGAITVPARTLSDYIAAATDESITVEVHGTDVGVKSEHHKATIKGLGAEEFPIIPHVEGGNWIKVPANRLKTAINCVSIAAALDETRPVLAGVYFKVRANEMMLVATDSYRLAEYKIQIEKKQSPGDFIIPARAAMELARILPAVEGDVEIAAADNQAEFKFDDIQFLSRQIEGAFPDYEQIIPKEFSYKFEASKGSLAEAIKTVGVIARDAGNNLKLSGGDQKISISAAANQVGDAEATISVASQGTPLTISFNSKYILDAINILEANDLTFSFSGTLTPGLIEAKGNDNYRYIIMPLRSE